MLAFVFLFLLYFSGLALSFYFFKRDAVGKQRVILWWVVGISFVSMFAFIGLRVKPWFDQFFPVNHFFATISNTIWYVLIVLFLGALSGLAKNLEKKAVLALNLLFAVMVLAKLQYLVKDPWIYKSDKHARDGICEQSSYFSSGPAAAVNYLSLDNVYITEGQAAKEAKMQPWFGTTLLQATFAVNESLRKSGIDRSLELQQLDKAKLSMIKRPFLAVVQIHGLNHIVCVEKVSDGFVYVNDSKYGKVKKSYDDFIHLNCGVIAL